MQYLLDTNICIYIIKKNPLSVFRHFEKHTLGDVGISSITLAELQYGVAKSQQQLKNRDALNRFILPLEILPFDQVSADIYGTLRNTLERLGTPIGSLDALIAAQAVTHGLTVVTNNVREFERVQDLKIENWA